MRRTVTEICSSLLTTAFTKQEFMRFDYSSGNVGIGDSTPARKLTVQGVSGDTLPVRVVGGSGTVTGGIEFQDASTTADYKVQIGSIGDNLYLRAGGHTALKCSSTGDVQIGDDRVNQGAGRYVDIYNAGSDSATFSIIRLIRQQAASTSLTTSEFYARKDGETTLWNFEPSNSAYLRAGVGSTEGWRIHSSGNVLLGKSSPAFGTAGVELNNAGVAGKAWITRSGGEPLALKPFV